MNIAKVLYHFYKDKSWKIFDSSGASLLTLSDQVRFGYSFEWTDASPKPSADELASKWTEYQAYESLKIKINGVKEKARKRIIDLTGGGDFWREKQTNSLSRKLALFEKKINSSLTDAEKDELSAINSFWNKVNAIREHSDYLENEIKAGRTPTENWPY